MNLDQRELHDSQSGRGGRSVLRNSRFLTCPACGWVHYAMTTAEKVASDAAIERYHLSEMEQQVYESTWRQCLQCEAPASAFRAASAEDLARAAGHLVTPVFVGAAVGTQ